MLPFFIFNGIDSSDYLIVKKLPSIFKAEKNIKKIEIEGRDGFLTEDFGTYKSIPKSVECTIKDTIDIDFLCSWLDGSGEVVFSNEPNKKYKATIINQIEFKKIFTTFHSFIIQFDCQPHKYAFDNNLISLASPGTIYNPYTANSKPILKVYGNGSITLNINSNNIYLTNVIDYVIIDSELVDCYRDTVLKNNDMDGEFPEFLPGSNAVSWTGTVTKVEITPNWRWN
ncbi:distal tail protein Dit [Clostridium omnivorum]|uniref:Siphovirus-type tail component RIFT-related domain-containing protein n=1 Tax=Clostridium omnivorum TaxID=1604902 RepID=A0ABQ5NCC7_9CLOT|nr:distal tail protein Dit [Clostridium sp. E14]GLC32924.1 hypothetical protein bsdE14_43340 [Clostridium sp. E14]